MMSLLCLFVSSFTFFQPPVDTPPKQEEGTVHLPTLRCQHRLADHDPHLTQLPSGLHQQLPLQLSCQQLLRAPFSRRDQVCRQSPSMNDYLAKASTQTYSHSLTNTCVSSHIYHKVFFPVVSQPLIQLPSSHQSSSVPAAVVPAEGSQRFRPHTSSCSAFAVLLFRSPAPPHCLIYVHLPQQLQL